MNIKYGIAEIKYKEELKTVRDLRKGQISHADHREKITKKWVKKHGPYTSSRKTTEKMGGGEIKGITEEKWARLILAYILWHVIP